MLILAFGHRKQVGKDSICTFAKRNIGFCTHRSFAKALKEQTYELYSWAGMELPEYYNLHPEAKEVILPALGKTPRRIWIEYGNMVREIYQDTWIDLVLKKQTLANILVISDLRYPNEFKRVKELGGFCIHVSRPGIEVTHDVADDALAGKQDWDGEIINSGTLIELEQKTLNLIGGFLHGTVNDAS